MKFKFLLLIWMLIYLSCDKTQESECINSTTGILKNFTGLDGCGWIILLTDSTRLEPINLDDFKLDLVEGKTIHFRFRQRKDMVSICMVGKIIEIDCIRQD